ncbi:major facilitator superfamily transporter [Colletotrichum cereale]|nr:major facilitator superfamily transporter [Colletotrichum cereale]
MTARTSAADEKSGSAPGFPSNTPSETTLTPAAVNPEPRAATGTAQSPPTTLVPDPVPDGGLEAWLQVLGSWVILAHTWGLVNTFGVYQTYYERTLHDTTPSAISWIGSLQGALLMMVGPISGPLYDAGYFRELLWAGIFLILFGMFMTSLCTTYCQYFDKRRALVMGLAATGSPVAGMCFPILFGHLEPKIGFGWATRIIAFILLGLSIIPAVTMHTRLPPSGHKRSLVDQTTLRDPTFMLVVTGSFIGFLAMYVPYFYIQLFAVNHDIGPSDFSAYFVTLLSAGSIPGRVIPNYLADKVGALYMHISVAAGSAVLMFAWLGIRNMAGLVVFAILYGLFSGGMVSISPTVVVSLSPDLSRVGTRMGMMNFIGGIAILVGTPIAGAILGDYSEAAWQSMIGYGAAALTVGSMCLTLAKIFQFKSAPAWSPKA